MPITYKEMDKDCLLGYPHKRLVAAFSEEFDCIGKAYLGHDGAIFSVRVHEKHRNKGIATELVRRLTNYACAKKMTPFLSVFKDNAPAVRAYEKCGYKIVSDNNLPEKIRKGVRCFSGDTAMVWTEPKQ